MTAIDSVALDISWVGLFAAPLIAFILFAFVHKRWATVGRQAVIAGISTIAFIVAAAALGFSFKNVLFNFAFFAIAYGAYCFLAACCWRIRFLPLRILALLCAAIPICAGYVAGTIGVLGLMFIIGDYTRAPNEIKQIDIGLECRVTLWGMAASASGYTIHLYRSWNWLPFIERAVVSIPVTQVGYVEQPQDATCADAVAQYRR
jgi:hypothetical protein